MDTQNQNQRTLSEVVNQLGDTPTSFQTYLTIFTINLTYRFPDVRDLSSIDHDQIRWVAEFSAACTSIATDTWNTLFQSQDVRRRMGRTRAA